MTYALGRLLFPSIRLGSLLLAIISLVGISDARSAGAVKNFTCTMRHSGDECRLSCASESSSHVCDDPTKQCRSSCGLYDNNGSATEVLQGLSDALTPKMPLRERLDRSSAHYLQIVDRLKKVSGDLRPRSFSLVLPKRSPDAFSDDVAYSLDRLFETATVATEGSAVVQFSLNPVSVQRIQRDGDPKQMLDEATAAILKALPER
jgi:hypothetical protein